MRCHWAKDDDGLKFWLPGCFGGAVYGKNGCTCYKPIDRKLRKKSNLTKEDYERELYKLRDINDRLNRQNKKLSERVLQLEIKGLPLEIKRSIERMDSYAEKNIYVIINRLKSKKYG